MALPLSDQAEILAQSLGIDPGSYAGRQADAVVAMSLIAGYRVMTREDQAQVLYVIRDKMGFGESNPAFFIGCQTAQAMIVFNPVWVPGSLTNDELEREIRIWRGVKKALAAAGFGTAGKVGLNNLRRAAENHSLDGLKPSAGTTGLLVFGTLAQSVAYASLADLQAEVQRRGLTGAMTPLHVMEYGK